VHAADNSIHSLSPYRPSWMLRQLLRVPAALGAIEARRTSPSIDRLTYLAFVKPGQTVIDVGANIGATSYLLSRLVGARGHVIALEPSTTAYRALSAAVAGSGNVTALQTALGSADGTADLTTPEHDFAQSSLHLHEDGSWAGSRSFVRETVKVHSLDSLVKGLNLHRLDFIKIDAEGHEMHILSGASAAFRAFRPLVYIEINEQWLRTTKHTATDIREAMRTLGYGDPQRLAVTKDRLLTLVPDRLESPVNGDFLFCPLGHSR
jgi:FkbM family methyltransferase